jgi:hypothetical protein
MHVDNDQADNITEIFGETVETNFRDTSAIVVEVIRDKNNMCSLNDTMDGKRVLY